MDLTTRRIAGQASAGSRAKPSRLSAWLAVGALAWGGACGGDAATQVPTEATLLWSAPDSSYTRVLVPRDFQVSSRSRIWAADGGLRAIFVMSPPRNEYGLFGYADREPAEVVDPWRLAVAADIGVIAFDRETGRIDHYSPSGEHLRGFDPGFAPSVLEIRRRPIGLTFGVVERTTDTLPRLMVIQSDLMGGGRDTLLDAERGPESLRSALAMQGETSIDASQTGLWIRTQSVADTVFEVSPLASRRLVPVPEHREAVGILADLEEDVLWIVQHIPTGGLRHQAYDVSGTGLIDGASTYIGERTTPADFTPQAAYAGAVFGWRPSSSVGQLAAAYDMRLDELRAVHARKKGRATSN